MSTSSPTESKNATDAFDIERQASVSATAAAVSAAPKSLGAGSALALGAFGTTLTTLSLSLMEWRGVTITNVYVGNFFFIAAFGLVITAQWELSVGNGFAYTVFSAFGLFYAGYGAILTPAFGVAQAYGSDTTQYNNALGFFMILWTVFVFTFLIASLPINLANIAVFFFVDLGFLTVAASYFADADGHADSARALRKTGGASCFVAGMRDNDISLPLKLSNNPHLVDPRCDVLKPADGVIRARHLQASSAITTTSGLLFESINRHYLYTSSCPVPLCSQQLFSAPLNPSLSQLTIIITTTTMTQSDVPATDPAVYEAYKTQWASLPDTADAWLARAREVATVLSQDAAQREQENKSPRAEVALLKHSGLLKLLGPKKYGGGEQPWSVGYKAIREVAKGDGSIGMLLGYHLLWSTTANIVGTPSQADRIHQWIITNNYFVGGAVNPRDSDLTITSDGEDIIFNGAKFFNTGGVVSDLTVLEGVLDGTGEHIFALVETRQAGIKFAHNWNNIGLRLTESGGVRIENVRAPWTDALGWDNVSKRPREEVLGVPFASLLLPTIQLVFSNFYLGIAQGALDFASQYTVSTTRPWPFGGDNKASATDEFYILERYGNFFAHLRAAEALADRAGEEISTLYREHSDTRPGLTARQRGELAEWIASVKVVTTDVGLRVTSGIFEVTGARATAVKVGLDRFWRDIRTHTLHDPVAYKNRELGRYALLGEVPEPSWYT
ncbi:thermophilic desulfurizing enzyme family protein [Aspergillus costaricaensis CBS 115574]|uniref:Thermophilic desulfurizing enzyme family protein n=1 Tax=Aspergillus costaricaensis CBS 115574 TaxID=1448317 RepID=A0ACD1IER2_9EURO|nr:thermophilic desulfurizing enzyme family protein [Aspergillus costaricaensis CBS 115574]RAK88235.1 thermophilic desulfurizing enzyme family protein [Aspergillus costaricaensis CBS 115574]